MYENNSFAPPPFSLTQDSHKHRVSLGHTAHAAGDDESALVLSTFPLFPQDSCSPCPYSPVVRRLPYMVPDTGQPVINQLPNSPIDLSRRIRLGKCQEYRQTFEMIIQIDDSLNETTISGGTILHKPMICSRGC